MELKAAPAATAVKARLAAAALIIGRSMMVLKLLLLSVEQAVQVALAAMVVTVAMLVTAEPVEQAELAAKVVTAAQAEQAARVVMAAKADLLMPRVWLALPILT